MGCKSSAETTEIEESDAGRYESHNGADEAPPITKSSTMGTQTNKEIMTLKESWVLIAE